MKISGIDTPALIVDAKAFYKNMEENIMAVKTETLSIKVSPEEKQMIKDLAEKEDITISKYLYRMIFKKEEK